MAGESTKPSALIPGGASARMGSVKSLMIFDGGTAALNPLCGRIDPVTARQRVFHAVGSTSPSAAIRSAAYVNDLPPPARIEMVEAGEPPGP